MTDSPVDLDGNAAAELAEQRDRWRASSAYDVLVQHCGAHDSLDARTSFVLALMGGCDEYRFQGSLGFGGKYRPINGTVDCYPEDLNPARADAIQRTNEELSKVLGGIERR